MKIKSVPAVLLIVILALQSGGMLLLLKLKQELIRFEMSSIIEMDAEQLEILTLSKEEFETCRLGRREIVYQNKLYDIVSWSASDGEVSVVAYNDSNEKNILEHIKEVASNTGNHTHGLRNIKIVLFNFVQPEFAGLFHDNSFIKVYFSNPRNDIPASGLKIPSPPPKVFC
jgi:hypothetical protein